MDMENGGNTQKSSISVSKETRDSLKTLCSITGKSYDELIKSKFTKEFKSMEKLLNLDISEVDEKCLVV